MELIAWFVVCIGSAVAGGLPVMDGQALSGRVRQANDTLYVVNFWATWCKPCVEELPYFEGQRTALSGSPVRILLASLDFASNRARIQRFLYKNKYGAEAIILHDPNQDQWINSIDSSWSGALPATVLYRKGQKLFFYEGAFTSEDLHNTLIKYLAHP